MHKKKETIYVKLISKAQDILMCRMNINIAQISIKLIHVFNIVS